MKKQAVVIIGLVLALSAAGCSKDSTSASTSAQSTGSTTAVSAQPVSTATTAAAAEGSQSGTTSYSAALTLAYDENDLDASWDQSKSSLITLAGGTVRFDGSGATASGTKVTITQAGTYAVTGQAQDAQIVIDCKEVGLVRLVLNGADLTCASSAPIYAKNAEKVVLILADGTQNSLTDGETYTLDADSNEPNAALFVDTDLTINGGGALSITATFNDGITSTDNLKIVSGTITVDAANDAVKGKDSLGIKEAALTISAKGDGLQSTNDTAPDKGFICISGGTLDVSAGADGIQAASTLLVSGGDLSITTGGGSENAQAHQSEFGGMGGFPGGGRDGATWGSTTSSSNAPTPSGSTSTATQDAASSSKGLKADGGVFVEGGTFALDCADDTIHSNGSINVGGGAFTMASGDDAIHADVSVTLTGGDFAVSTCYEGIESNSITIDDGKVVLKSDDDAFNGVSLDTTAAVTTSASGSTTTTIGRTGAGFGGGFPGEWGNAKLTINGGYIALDAGGDGIDINGGVEMNGGTVIVNGPINDGNGALDYVSGFKVTGGLLIAAGSSGMAEAPDESSTQYSIMVNFDQSQAAGTIVRVVDESGTAVLTMAPAKQFRSLVLCSSNLKKGATYKIYLGGSMTGTATDTVYADGTYSGGAEYASLTLDSVVTLSGSAGMMGGGMGGHTQGGTGGGPQGGRPGRDQGTTGGTSDTVWGTGSTGGTAPAGGTPPTGGTAPAGGTPPSGGAAPGGAAPGGSAPGAESSS
jgi:hypothetical protein